MASASKSVWAIDVGNSSLKAVCFRLGGDNIEVTESIVIEHSFILSAPGVDEARRENAIAEAITKLVERRDLRNEEIIVSVAGQTSFARFIKLPPVDKKKIPKMIQFEAQQQIPFDIHEVEWDYQLMTDPDTPDASVGIFAIKNDLIASILSHYTSHNIRIGYVQMAPIALYNYVCTEFDDITASPKKATIILDMGTDNTNLVICAGRNIWQRCIPMGGNSFTQAIADAFSIDFEKAEKYKRAAVSSKYSKQIFQAMKPVYTKMSEEIQRSIGYYLSTSNVEFTKLIASGGGFRLQGIAKFIQQSLGVKIVMPSDFKKLTLTEDVNAAKFHESVLDLGVVYGLGVQALGKSPISTNLLPRKLARTMAWKQKARYFNIAAAMLLVVAVLAFGRAMKDKIAYSTNSSVRSSVQNYISTAQQVQSELSEQESKNEPLAMQMDKYFGYFDHRDIVPAFVEGIVSCLPSAASNPQQAPMYEAFAAGDIKALVQTPRNERKQIFVTSVTIDYSPSIASAQFGQTRAATTRRDTRGGGGMDMGMGMGMPGMDGMGMGMDMGMGMGMGMDMGMGMGMGMGGLDRQDAEAADSDGPGFVVILEGYTPYENIGELMDPPGVADNKDRWGLITYLENFANVYTRNKLSLFEKSSSNHFIYEHGVVEIGDSKMPVGIGKQVTKIRVEGDESTDPARRAAATRRDTSKIVERELVLIDPMTGEEMSKTFMLDSGGVKQFDAYGQEIKVVRDNWFRIKAKFLWKDAPGDKADSGADAFPTF